MSEAVVLSGHLRKSPPVKKLRATWHKRYFVLRSNKHLEYFKNEKEKKPLKGPIDLHNCKSVEAGLYHKSFKHVFSIKTSERLYYLVANSKEEMETWVEKLCEVCGFIKLEGRNSPDFFTRKNQSSSPHRSPVIPGHSPRKPGISPAVRSFSPCSLHVLSLSSQMSRLSMQAASPTGYCPVSNLVGPEGKLRSFSDPPEFVDQINRVPSHRNMSLSPDIFNTHMNRSSISSECYDTVPPPRPVSQDVYDVVPPPREDPSSRNSGQDYDIVPPPRPDDGARGRRSSARGDYDTLPAPRPVSALSSGSDTIYDSVPRPKSFDGQDFYDVPPLRHSEASLSSHRTSAGNYDTIPPPRASNQDTYDVVPPPRGVVSDQETYDVVPPLRGVVSDQDTYDVVPPPRGVVSDQDTYDVVPPPRGVVSDQDTYDVVPPPRGVVSDQDTYDVVPPPHGVVSDQDTYDVVPPPRGVVSDQDTYDVVPPPRGVVSDQDTYDVVPPPRGVVSDQDTYDVVPPPRGVVSDQETYDVVPPLRGVVSDPDTYDVVPYPRGVVSDQETYDVLPPPRPMSQDLYDVVPHPRRNSDGRFDTNNTLPRPGGLPSTVLKDPPQEIYDTVPPPKPSPYKGNVYDVVPNPNKNVSLDASLESNQNSFSNQCSLSNRESGYNLPLPSVPSELLRDSGMYGSGDIYNYPSNGAWSGEGHETQLNVSGNQGVPPTNQVPQVNRSSKPPPQVNRMSKPVPNKDHSYCNMPPPINRGKKPMHPPTNKHLYENYPSRNMHLSLERIHSMPVNAPYQNNHVNQSESGGDSYCHMAPRRLESTRCYSFSKTPLSPDESYEEMAPLSAAKRKSSSSSSSSSSFHEDDDEVYTAMDSPSGSLPKQPQNPKRKDLQYAEVQITEGSPRNRQVHHERPNTHYTFINEESTKAFRQACHARQEDLNN